jgi:hypothetical protein
LTQFERIERLDKRADSWKNKSKERGGRDNTKTARVWVRVASLLWEGEKTPTEFF